MPIAASIPSYRHRSQPQYNAQVDWSHPLARGLVFFVIPNTSGARDLVGGGAPTSLASTTMGVGMPGRAMVSQSTTSGGWIVPYRPGIFRTMTNEFTIATQVDIDSQTGFSKLVGVPLFNTWTDPYNSIYIGRSSSTSQLVLGLAGDDGSGLNTAIFPPNSFQVAKNARYVATRSGATARLLHNGAWLSPATATTLTANANVQFNTQATVGLMNRAAAATAEGTAGSMYYAAIWNRALTEAESRSFQENPYQILKPTTNALYLFQDATSTGAVNEFTFEFDQSFGTAVNSFNGASKSTTPKFSSKTIADRTVPISGAASSSRLPKFTTTASVTRAIPPQGVVIKATMPTFDSKAIVTRASVTRAGPSISTTPKFDARASVIRGAPGFSIIASPALPRFTSRATGVRAIPSLATSSASSLPRFTTAAGVISLAPPGVVIPTTANHRRAPSWRLADAGTGQSGLGFASPLDPNSKTYFTIDWAQELSGSGDALWMVKEAIGAVRSPAAIVAGLEITAITFDSSSTTVWLKVADDQANASYWSGNGETHIINFTIKTLNGQVFNRDVSVTIRQL